MIFKKVYKVYLAALYLDPLIRLILLGSGKSCCLLMTPGGELDPDLPMRGTLKMVGPIPRTAPRSAIDDITAPPVVSSLIILTSTFHPPRLFRNLFKLYLRLASEK